MSTRNWIAGVVGCVLLAGSPAIAADAPAVYEEPEFRPSVHDWTGLYAGLHVGHSWGTHDVTVVGGDDPPVKIGGLFFGGQVGMDYQFDQFVLGAVGDFTWSESDQEDWRLNQWFSLDTKWISTLRARAGYSMDKVLLYATAGIAFAEEEVTLLRDERFPTLPGGVDSQIHMGWALGGGVEAMMTDNLSAGVEYLYLDFNTERYTLGSTLIDVDPSTHLVRLGVNYRMNM